MGRIVVISTNDNKDYYDHIPYVREAWNKLGWDTITFTVDMDLPADERNKSIRLNYSLCRRESAAQLSRLLVGHYVDEGMVMTSDADMIPLINYWQPKEDKITVYGFDLTGKKDYPICYIAMPAQRWRDLVPETTIDELANGYTLLKSDNFYDWWGADQQIITSRINQYAKEGEVESIERGLDAGLPKGRIDRSDWEGTISREGKKIDAHVLRPFNQEQVERIMNMIEPFGLCR